MLNTIGAVDHSRENKTYEKESLSNRILNQVSQAVGNSGNGDGNITINTGPVTSHTVLLNLFSVHP